MPPDGGGVFTMMSEKDVIDFCKYLLAQGCASKETCQFVLQESKRSPLERGPLSILQQPNANARNGAIIIVQELLKASRWQHSCVEGAIVANHWQSQYAFTVKLADFERECRARESQRMPAVTSDSPTIASPLARQPQASAMNRSPSPEDLPRQIGPFRILKALGKGAMGAVYLGEHKDLGLKVAIKVILGMVDPELVERFRREAKTVIGLSHPNFVRGYTVDLDHDPRYIAIEFVEGDDFDKGIGKYDLYEKIAKLRDVCRGVQAMHEKGLVHRDLKPANIRLDVAGRVVVMDPGMVKSVAGKDVERVARALEPHASPELTEAGTLIGTPMYMAPEQVDERAPIAPYTDVHALGKIIVYTLTGEHVHLGKNMMDLLAQIVAPEVPSHVGQSLRKVFADEVEYTDISAAVHKALDPQPVNRQQMAGELADDLTGILDKRVQRERDERERARMQAENQKALIRKLAVAGAVIVVLLAISLLAVIFFAQASKAEQKAAEEAKGRLAEAQARAEAEGKSARDAQARAEAESAARQADTRRLNVAERLNDGQRKMAEADWRGAISVYEAILVIDTECYAARWPLAEAKYNIFDLSFIEQYRWLSEHAPTEEEKDRAKFWTVFAGIDRGAVNPEQAPAMIRSIQPGLYHDLAELYYAGHERALADARNDQRQKAEWEARALVLIQRLESSDHWLVAFVHAFLVIGSEPDRAVDLLTECISRNPAFPMAYYWRAAILNEDTNRPPELQRRQPLAAVHDAERLHALMPGWPKGELTRVQAYLFMARNLGATDVDAALTWFDRAQDLLKEGAYGTWQARSGNVYEEQGGSIEANMAYVLHHRANVLRQAALAKLAEAERSGNRAAAEQARSAAEARWSQALEAVSASEQAYARLNAYVNSGHQLLPNIENLRRLMGQALPVLRRGIETRQRN